MFKNRVGINRKTEKYLNTKKNQALSLRLTLIYQFSVLIYTANNELCYFQF